MVKNAQSKLHQDEKRDDKPEDLVVVIENNFGFKVKPEDFTGIITYQDFCNYVISRVNVKELV